MVERLISTALVLNLFFLSSTYSQAKQAALNPNDLVIEGLYGRVKRIDEETASLTIRNGVSSENDRRPTRRAVFDKDGRITYEWARIEALTPFEHRYHYDKSGNQHRQTGRPDWFEKQPNAATSIQLSLKTYFFRADANVLYVDEYRGDRIASDSLRQKYQYYFDKAGRLAKRVTLDSKDREVFRTVYVYSTEQLPIETRLSMAENPVGQIFKYEYAVDSVGNWVKRISEMTILKTGVNRREVTYRKISYYK